MFQFGVVVAGSMRGFSSLASREKGRPAGRASSRVASVPTGRGVPPDVLSPEPFDAEGGVQNKPKKILKNPEEGEKGQHAGFVRKAERGQPETEGQVNEHSTKNCA